MRVFKAPEMKSPEEQEPLKIFLAGSIEMGVAEDWQTRVTNMLEPYNVEIYNPRRDDWDSSWEQDPTKGTQFREQVDWELDNIKECDLILFYFDPETKSPITLMELGLALGLGKSVLVCCPKEFFRYGNVAVIISHFTSDDVLFINESEWFAQLELTLDIQKALTKAESVEIEESTENQDLNNKSKITILRESANSNFEHYIEDKYNIKEQ